MTITREALFELANKHVAGWATRAVAFDLGNVISIFGAIEDANPGLASEAAAVLRRGWCRVSDARKPAGPESLIDNSYYSVDPRDPDACEFCLQGAYLRAFADRGGVMGVPRDCDWPSFYETFAPFASIDPSDGTTWRFNDALESVEPVLALCEYIAAGGR